MVKRTLSLLLTLVMVLSMLPGNLVRAAEDNTDQIYIDDSINFDEFTDMSDVDDGMFEELSDIPDILDIPEDKLDPLSTDNWIHEMSPDDTLGLLPDESTNVDQLYSEAESDVFQTEDENPVEGSGSLGGFVSGNMTQTNDSVPVDTSLTWYADEDGDDVDSSGIAINTQKGKPSFDGGNHTITIKPAEGTSTDATRLHINLYQLYAINNADVTVELDAAEFANYPLITEVVIHAVAAEEYLFYIRSGSSLTLKGLEDCRIVVSGADVSDQAVSTRNLILLYSATSLKVDYAAFRYAPDKAVHSYGETLSFIRISNSIFESTCRSDNRGGAVYVSPRFRPGGEGSYYFTHLDEFTLTNCQFLGNTSGQTGGAVCLYGTIDQVSITGCKFSNTEITGENQFGGAIALIGVFENITINGEFEECTSAGAGGAIGLRASADQVSISGTFTKCNSEKSGGAIYVVTAPFNADYYSFNQGASNYYSRIKALDITNSSFTSCSATGQGGVLNIAAQIKNVSLEGITFTGCSSTASSGGAVYFGSASLNEGYMWRDFKAEDDTHRDETSSYWAGDDRTTIGTVTIGDYTEGATPVHTSFTNCSAQSNGGAFIVSAQTCIDSFSIENTTISGCQSTSSGGSAAFFSDSVVPKIEFDHCVISGCSVDNESGSGTVCVANSCTAVLTMTDCTFSGNTSGHSGGGIAWRARNIRTDRSGQKVRPTATLTRCTFTENTATSGYGGGVDCLARMSVIDCDFMSNTAVRGGGIALRIDDDDGLAMEDGETTSLSLDSDTVIAGNEAKYGGGVIVQANATKAINDDSTDSHSISFTLNGTAVRNNEASIHGGGICFVTITDADSSAEAAEATRFGKLGSIQNADIHDNIAGCYGGGLYLINDNNSNLSVDNCYIYANACGTVGEYLSVNPDGTTTGSFVSTGGLGGGIYLKGNGSTVGITNCVIGAKRDGSYTAAGNTAKEFYKELYDGKEGVYYGGGGAGIAIEEGASVLLTGGRVVNNTAESIGGGIYIQGASTLTVNKGTFNGEEIIPQISNNTIRYLDEETIRDDGHGGGVAVVGSGTKLTLDNGVIKSNKAYGGGGIYVNSYGEVEVRNGGSIQSNTDATYGGGILANVNGHVLIVGGTITQNRASTGGGIYVNANSEVTVKSGTISSNTAEMNGGGIVAGASDTHGGSDVNIEGGTINDNTAGSKGGGVYATGGDSDSPDFASNVLITEGLIDNNTANSHGGGVYAGESCTVTINNGSITNNTAVYNGGGITCMMKATLTLNGGTIADNEAGSGGGIAALGAAKIFVNNGTVQENKAVAKVNDAGDGSSNGYGGGIYGADNSEIIITGGTITKNRAKLVVYNVDKDLKGGGYGGGIAAVGGAKITVGLAQSAESGEPAEAVVSVRIIGNVGELNGGGIYATGNKSAVKDEDGNTVKDESGNIVYDTQQSNVTVNAGKISGNSAEEGHGGGIYATGATGVENGSAVVTLNGGEISDNTSLKGNGGGIYTYIYASVTLNGGTISANTAVNGCGIYSHANSSVTIIAGLITLNGANIESPSGAGGAIYARSKATVTMNGGSITLNKARVGGGIYANEGSTVTVTEGDITGNTAVSGGGGIYAYGGDGQYSTIKIEGGTISRNIAQTGNGGGVFAAGKEKDGVYPEENSAHITINGGEISDNTSVEGNGGGIYSSGGSVVTISDGEIYNNHAQNGGGVYANISTTLTIINGQIYGHSIKGNGAGVYANSFSTVTVTGGQILNNTAGNDGGGFYGNANSHLTIAGGLVENNKARAGGGIFATGNSDTYDENGKLVEEGARVLVSGGQIYRNTAKAGAGLYVTKGNTVTVQGGEISHNTASGNGGGICVATDSGTPTVKITKVGNTVGRVMENTAYNGGGVYVGENGTLTVTGGHIINNQAVVPKNAKLPVTGYQQTTLYGAGGGICVAGSSGKNAVFTLSGDMAVYGNTAGFAGDEVFSNGMNTKLKIPEVSNMNLSGYDLEIVGWFEDYNTDDASYTSGLNMKALNNHSLEQYPVKRYRNSTASDREAIKDQYVSGRVNLDNAYVAMALGIPAAFNDTVVVDYGMSVDIDLLSNDMLLKSEGENMNPATDSKLGLTLPDEVADEKEILYSPLKDSNGQVIETGFKRYLTDKADDTTSILNRGTANWKLENGTENGVLTYKMNVSQMDKEDVFYYLVPGERFYYYAAVTVIPASTLYYEDNSGLVTYYGSEDGYADWEEVPDDAQSNAPVQNQDRPGMSSILEVLDADNIYGYDSNYATSNTYSGGSAYRVEVTPEKSARASFTFTGTGFDIVSLCSNTTGLVMVNVFRGEVTDFYDPSIYNEDTYVVSYLVDTYYGYKYENGEWVVDPDADSTLYQVPVIKADLTNVVWSPDDPSTPEDETVYKNFGYGTYTVELVVGTSWTPGSPTCNNAEFYLDAIRIYNPVDVSDSGSESVQDAYLADGEAWPAYAELRNLFIEQGDLQDENPMVGVLFIDGQETPTLETYRAWGPNNEIYLNPGQSVAFTVDAENYGEDIAAIHLGVRGLTGKGKVLIQAGDKNASGELVDVETILSREVSTTDLYYDISNKVDGVVTIANKVVTITNPAEVRDAQGNVVENTAPIAISNLKVTHNSEPGKRNGSNQSGTGEVVGYGINRMIRVDSQTAQIALDILTPEQLTDPVVTPKRPALSFNGMVCYNVFFSAEELGDLTAADLGLAVFTTEDTDGTVETADEVHLGATEIDGLYMVATDGVHAKYLGDTKYFRAFAKKADGSYVYSKMVSYSAVDYAMNALAKSDDVKLKQLVVAMLNYGAEAQKFFGYKTADLMNKGLTADQQALLAGFDASSLNPVGKVDASKVGAFASTGGFTKRSPAISFKGAFEINYFFTPANAVDGDMTLYFWNEDTYNSVNELTAENADKAVAMTLENGSYTAASDEIAAKYLDKTVYVAAVYESGGVTYCSGVLPYSIAAYCQKPPAGVQDLATAAAVYGCTAKQYFGA